MAPGACIARTDLGRASRRSQRLTMLEASARPKVYTVANIRHTAARRRAARRQRNGNPQQAFLQTHSEHALRVWWPTPRSQYGRGALRPSHGACGPDRTGG